MVEGLVSGVSSDLFNSFSSAVLLDLGFERFAGARGLVNFLF